LSESRPSTPPLPSPASSRARKRASAVEQRTRRRRAITWTLLAVLVALLVNALVGDSGYLATVRASRDAAALEGQVFALRHENQDLIEQSHRLEQDAATIEDEARRSLGMLDPGEVVFVLRDATTAAPPAAKK
jgi:cell division protein FtsB